RADMLGGVDRVLLVDRVGERNVAVFVLAPLGVDVFAFLDLLAHGSSGDGCGIPRLGDGVHTPEGNVSGTSPGFQAGVRSIGSTARVRSDRSHPGRNGGLTTAGRSP